MNSEIASSAIILKIIPFQENKVILHLFTKDLGYISAVASTAKGSYFSSMMLIEGVFKKSKSDLYKLTKLYILDTFSNLRKDFTLLQLAAKLMNILSKTLVKDKVTLPLFILTKNTLKAFSKDSCPKPLYHCFILKLLLFEGLLPTNALEMNKNLSEEEVSNYLTLATAKTFDSIKMIPITPFFEEVMEEYVTFTLS